MTNSQKFSCRLLVYLIGMLVLSFGITISTKSVLGVSPISSIILVLSVIFKQSFALINFIWLSLFIVIQWALLRKDFHFLQWGQIIANLISSLFIEWFILLIPDPTTLTLKWIYLVIGIVTVGIGASLSIGMNLVASPADALAHTIGHLSKRGFGFGKNALDFISIGLAVFVSFAVLGRLEGVGVGTVIAMLFTGRVIALCHPWTEKLYQWLTSERGNK